MKKDEERDTINKAISKTNEIRLYYPAVVFGREKESLAIRDFIRIMEPKHKNFKFEEAGLLLLEEHPFLGGSIDGKITCDCHGSTILEIKCAYSIREQSVKTHGRQLQYLDENLGLKRTHTYFYQVQFYMGLYQLQSCYFCVWTPQDVHIIEIPFEVVFWRELKEDLCNYYYNHYLK